MSMTSLHSNANSPTLTLNTRTHACALCYHDSWDNCYNFVKGSEPNLSHPLSPCRDRNRTVNCGLTMAIANRIPLGCSSIAKNHVDYAKSSILRSTKIASCCAKSRDVHSPQCSGVLQFVSVFNFSMMFFSTAQFNVLFFSSQ